MKSSSCNTHIDVVGVPISRLTWDSAIRIIYEWAERNESRYVCICNSHSVVSAAQEVDFREVISQADLATADGAPVAWYMTIAGGQHQERINGPDLMWKYLQFISDGRQSIYLYGGTQATLEILETKIKEEYPQIQVAGSYSPPFRELTEEEQDKVIVSINDSGANVVWVGLGCPKQEVWMSQHRGKICGVMIGVGAAFDYHAGTLKRAPKWMQNNGLEWFYRFSREPQRLWKRYLVTNVLFLLYTFNAAVKYVLWRVR